MTSPITDLDEAKGILESLSTRVNSAARLTRTELKGVLAKVYAIRLSKADRDKLLEYIIEHRRIEGANRAFLFKKGNEFLLPLRYVFPGLADRTNVSRYSGAMRELLRAGTDPENFLQALKDGGGIVELYWKNRSRETKTQIRSKLTLDRAIQFQSGTEVTLRLMPTAGGTFRVLSVEHKA